MKRFLTAFLSLALLLGMLAVPVSASDADTVIDTPDAVFPADTTIEGDLILTGDCPETVILINVIVEGTLKIEADHPVTVRLQGDSRCEQVQLLSSADLIGGEYGTIDSETGIATLKNASAETLNLKKTGGYFLADGTLGDVTMDGANGLLGGSHTAKNLTVNQPNCTYSGKYDTLQKNFKKDDRSEHAWNNQGVEATLELERDHVSPAHNIIRGKLTFTKVPEEMEGDYRIYWYIGDRYAAGSWHFDVKTGAVAEFESSAHFDKVMPEFLPVWAELTSTADSDSQLRFVRPVPVKDYSTAEYKDLEYDDEIFPYEIHLLRDQNVIIVYGLDDQGKYSKIVNVFVCSVGIHNPTPTGEFEINYKARWGSLMLDLWGQYVSQFNGNMLFHSVPYRSRELFNIEWEEYNLLGTPASSGCVRLATCDAMWIYDHCRKGTRVTIYDNGSCPVDKPVPVFISDDSRLRGWDPTDPYEDNPTKAKNPPKITREHHLWDSAKRPPVEFQ